MLWVADLVSELLVHGGGALLARRLLRVPHRLAKPQHLLSHMFTVQG